MNWIRVAVGILHDPSIHAVADATGVSVPTTTGHVVGVLSYLPEHCRTGDLSTVPDATIERWAMWTGKRGKFASAFRAHLCTPQGVVRSWEKHNGAAIRESDADRKRKQEWRDARRKERESSAGRTPDVRVVSTRDVTGRDETGCVNNNSNSIPAPRKRAAPGDGDGPKYPHFPMPLCLDMHALWVSKFGAVTVPVFRKEFGPLFTVAEADRPSTAPTNAELREALKSYVDLFTMGDGATFATVRRAASVLAAIASARREYANEPERRLEAVMRIIHGRQRLAA